MDNLTIIIDKETFQQKAVEVLTKSVMEGDGISALAAVPYIAILEAMLFASTDKQKEEEMK